MSYLDYYRGKRVLVTGGTGSIGSEIVRQLAPIVSEVVVLSRSESKQSKLKNELRSKNVRFVIGDIRKLRTTVEACKNIDIVFHTAAMKHVDLCEENVAEAVETNLVGAENVRWASNYRQVHRVVVISTDKAANPEGIMGMTKCIQERLFLNSADRSSSIVIVRMGNIIGSDGSVVWKFLSQKQNRVSLTITSPEMIRFYMTVKEASQLILWAGAEAPDRSIAIRPMAAFRIMSLVVAMFGEKFADYVISGTRPGEKIEETLLTPKEMLNADVVVVAANGISKVVLVLPDNKGGPVPFSLSPYDWEIGIPVIRQMLTEAGVPIQ